MPPIKQLKLSEWLNTAIMLIGITSLVFIAGRKDQQLEDLVRATSDLVKISTKHDMDLMVISKDYASLKERLDALSRKQ
jgi:hypothetical protein